jgi:hypothetical protein
VVPAKRRRSLRPATPNVPPLGSDTHTPLPAYGVDNLQACMCLYVSGCMCQHVRVSVVVLVGAEACDKVGLGGGGGGGVLMCGESMELDQS